MILSILHIMFLTAMTGGMNSDQSLTNYFITQNNQLMCKGKNLSNSSNQESNYIQNSVDKKRCSIESCERSYYCKGFCQRHYNKNYHNGDPLYEKHIPEIKICKCKGCNEKCFAKGFCKVHYGKYRHSGDPLYQYIKQSDKTCSFGDCQTKCYNLNLCRKHYRQYSKGHLGEDRSGKHGFCETSEYSSWKAMKARCLNPNNGAYHNYGGRGITICDRWKDSFLNFLEDMGKKPSPKYTLERKAVNGNYELGNCEWITQKEQRKNTRVRSDCKSGVKGVSLRNGRFVAKIAHKGKSFWLGTFDTALEAGKARKEGEIKYWGKTYDT